jgi:hypothetical protein
MFAVLDFFGSFILLYADLPYPTLKSLVLVYFYILLSID